jgi:CoA:oxalate CoA-transferase
VDVSQQDSVLSLTENAVVSYTLEGKVARPLGNEHPFVRPYGLFPCKDGFVFFGGYTDKFWRLSCQIFGEPDLADDPRVATMAKRFSDDAFEGIVRPAVERWFAPRTKAELEQLAGDAVPLSAIKDIDEVVHDPQIVARDMVVEVAHPRYGDLRMVGSPLKLGATPTQPRTWAPELGEHTETVLRTLCGLTRAEVHALQAQGVVR